jgi:UDP:flavonoid glycosyltransferase YjiC (YdhE family)
MAHVVLTTWGSHGDIDPFLGLGLGLRARGHLVTIATIEYYRPLVESQGMQFRPLRPDVDPSDTALIERIMDRYHGSEFLIVDILLASLEDAYADVEAAAEGADLLVSHPVTFATPIVAQRRRLPWASVVLAPASMFSAYDYPALPPAPWIKHLEWLGPWFGRLIIAGGRRATGKWAEPLYRFRTRLGLPPGANPIFEGQHSPFLVLALYSRVLGEAQPDWPPHVVITGHIFHDAPHGTSLGAELEAFLADGPPPIVFTLGSSVVLIAKDFWKESIEALDRLGMRGILLAGPTTAPQLARDLQSGSLSQRRQLLAIERAPHSLLFPRAAAVVQQCGIGTLAQSLRSGRPMLGVPYSHDQPDNAWRARALGMSRTVYPGSYKCRRVAAELRRLIDDPSYATAAAAVARRVEAEKGVATACDALERTFDLRS